MITIFRNFYDMSPNYRPVDGILHRIKSGKSANQVERARLAYNDEIEYTRIKKGLPCILFSGMFEHRSIAGLSKHSGYICLDMDKFPDYDTLALWRDNLEGDEYTYCVFTSPSGMGLKCVVRIPSLMGDDIYVQHKAYFRGLQAYYNCEYFDPNVFDVSRICYESYDPELQINPNSRIWTGQVFDPEPVKVEYGKASLDQQETVKRLLVWIDKKGGVNTGNRNNNLFKLCIAFSDYGVDYEYAQSITHGFAQKDFTIKEIETTLKSAYKRGKQNFGKLSF